MKPLRLMNFAEDQWFQAASPAEVRSAVTGEVVAETGSQGLDFGAMARHAREVGGPALRKLTFHDRAWMLKSLAQAVMERKEELYDLSYETGCTRADSWGDIEGGAGTLFSYSSKGRRELPNDRILLDGPPEVAVEERDLRRPARVHPAAGRGRPHQRLQLPRLGHAGEAGPDPAGRRPGHRQAGHRHLLRHRARLPHPDGRRRAAARRACS